MDHIKYIVVGISTAGDFPLSVITPFVFPFLRAIISEGAPSDKLANLFDYLLRGNGNCCGYNQYNSWPWRSTLRAIVPALFLQGIIHITPPQLYHARVLRMTACS